MTPYTSLLIKEQDEGPTAGMEENQKDSDGDGVADAWEKSGNYSNSQSEMNMVYQNSYDIQTTTGANIFSFGNKIFADIYGTLIDLELLKDITTIELKNETIEDWILANLNVTQVITFGSKEYFALLDNDDFIEILAAGDEIVFKYGSDVFYITPGELPLAITNIGRSIEDKTVTITWYTNKPATSIVVYRLEGAAEWEIQKDIDLKTRHKIVLNLPDGVYEFYVSSEDGDGTVTTEDSLGKYYKFTTPNTQPPLQISNVSSLVEGKKVTVTWDTNRPAKGIVTCRLKGSSGTWLIKDETSFITQHSIIVTVLNYGIYEYYIGATDENENTIVDDNIKYFEIESDDKDNDGILDAWENVYGLDPADAGDASMDWDFDGLSNYEEYIASTSPLSSDTDNDILPDQWELQYLLDPTNASDAKMDSDEDGFSNLVEYKSETNPIDPTSRPASSQTTTDGYNVWWIFVWVLAIICVIVILGSAVMVHSYRKQRDDAEFYQDYQEERIFSEPFGQEFESWDNKYDNWGRESHANKKKPKIRLKKNK